MKDKPTYGQLQSENEDLKAGYEHLKDNFERLKCDYENLVTYKDRLEEQLAALKKRAFGPSADRAKAKPTAAEQGPTLFGYHAANELEQLRAEAAKACREVDDIREKRKKRARSGAREHKPMQWRNMNLEERRTVLLPEGVTSIKGYDVIGRDETYILHREPARFWVEVIERPKLRLVSEKNALNPRILQAPAPRRAVGGSHAGADVMAEVIVNKYRYHMPEYRQCRQFADAGVDVPASTLNGWLHKAADLLYPLYESQCELVRGSDYLQVDEVPVNVADRRGAGCRKGYAWQFADMRVPSRGTYFYYYKGSRAAAVPRAELRDFRGAIQTDGYRVYDYFDDVPGVTALGCMAHARRKFVEAQDNNPLAAQALDYIARLYSIEEKLRSSKAGPEEVFSERQRLSVPILDDFERWLELARHCCTPADTFGKALAYTIRMWPRLRAYTQDGRYQIDNNPVERGQRPVAMGRRNYLFSKNDRGAEDNAVFYTLIESCQIVGVDPCQWLRHALERLGPDTDEQTIQQLLPYNYKKSQA